MANTQRTIRAGVILIFSVGAIAAPVMWFQLRSGIPLGAASLDLEQILSIPVPADRAVSGIAAAGPNSLLAWSTSDGWLAIIAADGSQSRVAQGALDRPIGAAFVGEREVEVVEQGGNLVSLTREGLLRSRIRLRAPLDSLESAVHVAGTWYVGGWRSLDGRWAAYEATATEEEDPILIFPPDSPLPQHAQLSAHGSDVAATLSGPPFGTLSRRAGRPSVTLAPPPGVIPDSLRDGQWRSMKALRVDPGWVQVLFNPRSDTRILISFDEEGTVIRWTQIAVALGLFANGSDPHTIVGMRDIGASHREIVVYAWRWDRASHRNKAAQKEE